MKRRAWADWLLLVFPREFRETHRTEVMDFVESALADAGPRRPWATLTIVLDLLRAGVRLRLRPVRRRPTEARGPEEREGWMASAAHDVRLAMRGLSRSAGFSSVVVMTLALGVGLNTALFSVVNAVLLRPLGYEEPDRLAYLTAAFPNKEIADALLSGGDLTDLRQVESFETVEGIATIRQNLHGAALPRQVTVGWVSGGFLSMFGVAPELGRLHREDDPPGMVVLSHRVWNDAFGSDPGALGASIRLDGYPYTIIGVLPRDFVLHLPPRGGATPDIEVWKNPDQFWQNGAIWSAQGPEFGLIRAVARLRDGASFEDAQRGVDVVVADLRARFPALEADDFRISVGGLRARVVEEVRPTLTLLLGAVSLVLMIACANVANLLLVRGQGRRREMALRLALGSTRRRVGRYLMIESLLLSVGGTGIGLMVAAGFVTAVPRFAPPELPLVDFVGVDGAVLSFAVGASLIVTLLVGVLPALTAVRTDPATELGNGRVTGVRGTGVRRGLVVAQLALSIVLLVGAGLLTSSVVRLQRVDTGFDASDVYTFGISIPGSQYGWPEEANAYYREVEARIAALPGVESAGVVWPMPFSSGWAGEHDIVEGEPVPLGLVSYRLATESYFPTVRIPLLEGRFFREGDPTHVVLVSRVVAQRTWPGRTAVGRSLRANPWGRGLEDFEVIGVVGDVRDLDLRTSPEGTLYFDARSWSWVDWEVHVLVRTSVTDAALLPALRAALAEIDDAVPLAHPAPLADALRQQLAGTRFVLALLGVFAATAGLLAVVGLYGIISYSVGLRSREFGVRIALGSARSDILAMVIKDGGKLTIAGLALGLLGAWMLAGFLDALLFEVTATDPSTYVLVAVLLAVCAGIASWVPAWRVSRVNPVEALRAQ